MPNDDLSREEVRLILAAWTDARSRADAAWDRLEAAAAHEKRKRERRRARWARVRKLGGALLSPFLTMKRALDSLPLIPAPVMFGLWGAWLAYMWWAVTR